MPLKLAVVVASLPGPNPGMMAVNEAALQLGSSLDRSQWLINYFEPAPRYDQGFLTRDLFGSQEEVESHDKIIFWGDWLHSFTNFLPYRRLARATNEDVFRSLFLTGLPSTAMQKVAILGTTFLTDSPAYRTSPDYGSALRRLHSLARTVKMRDSFSSNIADTWRGGRDSTAGLDMAFLSDYQLRSAPETSRGIGVWFGRSLPKDRKLLTHFVKTLAMVTDLTPVCIPYRTSRDNHVGCQQNFRAVRISERTRPPIRRMMQESAKEIAERIQHLSLVVTDTYHLAVISWSIGVPCVLIGNTSNQGGLPVNYGKHMHGVDKRANLYQTFDAVPFFVPIEDLRRGEMRSRVRFLADEVIFEKHLSNLVLENIESRRRIVRSELAAFLGA